MNRSITTIPFWTNLPNRFWSDGALCKQRVGRNWIRKERIASYGKFTKTTELNSLWNLTGEEDSHSDVSGDSLASEAGSNSIITPDGNNRHVSPVKKALPSSLLKEIRIKGQQQQKSDNDGHQKAVKELSKAVESQLKVANTRNNKTSSRHVKHAIPTNICPNPSLDFEFYRFHLRENVVSLPDMTGCNSSDHQLGGSEDLSFVGLKDILSLEKSATIRSHKSGTVRGVRNRVRAGITTYLQGKTFKVGISVSLALPQSVFRVGYSESTEWVVMGSNRSRSLFFFMEGYVVIIGLSEMITL